LPQQISKQQANSAQTKKTAASYKETMLAKFEFVLLENQVP
jgi:hypothetical protein